MSLRAFQNYEIAKGRASGRMILSKTKSSSSGGVATTTFESSQLVTVDYKEWEDMLKKMAKLGLSLERRKLISLIKKASKITLQAAQRNVAALENASNSDTTGNLYDSIGFITGKSKEFVNVQVGPRVKRGFKGFHGAFVEYGTSSRSTRTGFNRGSARPKPYMKPAFDSTASSVVNNFKNEVANYVEQMADKIL